MAQTECNQVLIQTGYDYNVNKLASILKRTTDDSTVTERSTPTKAAILAGIDEEELPTSEEGETDNSVYDAMANLLGIE